MTQPGDNVDMSFLPRRQGQIAAEALEEERQRRETAEIEAKNEVDLIAGVLINLRNNKKGYDVIIKQDPNPEHRVIRTGDAGPNKHADTA